ncbi:MAG: hypothetical protein GY703_14120, partial [Gammaproteobacteria bacterium]|nr:hypothetical protein [Gammaproteobacteria bacterium]
GGMLENVQINSRNLTTSGWTNNGATTTFNQVGLDGSPNSATRVVDTPGTRTSVTSTNVVVSASSTQTDVARFFITKENDETRFPLIKITNDGATLHETRARINTQTGEVYEIPGDPGAGRVISVDGDTVGYPGWWIMYLELLQGAGSTTLYTRIWPSEAANLDDTPGAGAVAGGGITIGQVGMFIGTTIEEVQRYPAIGTVGSPQSLGADIILGQGTNMVTVETEDLDTDWAFDLKLVATDTVSTDSAERTATYTHYHRDALTVFMSEVANEGCRWLPGASGCVSTAEYIAAIGCVTPLSITWTLSDITGGSASIIAGQGTASCTVQTTSATLVGYRLTVNVA